MLRTGVGTGLSPLSEESEKGARPLFRTDPRACGELLPR